MPLFLVEKTSTVTEIFIVQAENRQEAESLHRNILEIVEEDSDCDIFADEIFEWRCDDCRQNFYGTKAHKVHIDIRGHGCQGDLIRKVEQNG